MMEIEQKGKLSLEQVGFFEYKKRQYICVRSDMIFYVSFQGRKKDIYIWYAIYPLSLPNICFGSGFGKCSGRIPKNENEISISSENDASITASKLNEILITELIPKFRSIKSISDIADDFLPWYPSAFAYFAMGNYEKGMLLLKDYAEFKNGLSEYSMVEEEVELFMNNATPESINSLLENERQNNIKKLKLRKYL